MAKRRNPILAAIVASPMALKVARKTKPVPTAPAAVSPGSSMMDALTAPDIQAPGDTTGDTTDTSQNPHDLTDEIAQLNDVAGALQQKQDAMKGAYS